MFKQENSNQEKIANFHVYYKTDNKEIRTHEEHF